MWPLLLVATCSRSFKVVDDHFEMDGKPFRFIGGSFHYFRQHPDDWEDMMKKLANGGMNAVETYVAWNLHEPEKGVFYWDGFADLLRFLDLAQKYNLYVIFRPGPYICAEWDFGGFPYWLLKEKDMKFRTTDEVFLRHIDDWMSVLLPKIKPYLYENGGPIITVQVENEYGYYLICQTAYMKALVDMFRKYLGDDVVLLTNDGPMANQQKCGAVVPYALETIDFSPNKPIKSYFETVRKTNGGGPVVVSEYHPGYRDHWTEPKSKRKTEDVVKDFDLMLSLNASVNFYMYFGGNNFGFYAGANLDNGKYTGGTTNYDFDAPIDHVGNLTYKYEKILEVVKKYVHDVPVYDVKNRTAKNYGKVKFSEGISVFDAINQLHTVTKQSDTPMWFEDLNVDYGYVIYKANTPAGKLTLPNRVRDRAYIFVDRRRYGILQNTQEKAVEIPEGVLEILVENQGRTVCGDRMTEKKGISKVLVDGVELKGWEHTGFNLSDIETLKFNKDLPVTIPSFYRATFNVDEVDDTFLNPTGFIKGIAFVNGHHIGRYWVVGPQLTLYVPRSWIKKGTNELIVFEQEHMGDVATMSFDDVAQLDIIQ